MQAIMRAYGIGTGGSTPTLRTGKNRAEGGVDIVNTPTQFVAGEAGRKWQCSSRSIAHCLHPLTQVVNHTGDFSHSIDAAVSSSVRGMDGRIVAAVSRALAEVLWVKIAFDGLIMNLQPDA